MEDVRGRFLWFDCMTANVDDAIGFYTAVMDWQTQAWKEAPYPYTMWMAGQRPIGGVMQLPTGAEAPPHWMAYIGTPDVDGTVARAEQLGAKVWYRPTDIPTVGRFAVLADPYGAIFAPYAPLNPPRPDTAPGAGDIVWHELTTTDVDGALAFYSDLFGWNAGTRMDMGPAGVYQIYRHGEKELGGMYIKPPQAPGPSAWMFYVEVKDLARSIATTRERGGTVIIGPHTIPSGDQIAICVDPLGAAFALHWTKPAGEK